MLRCRRALRWWPPSSGVRSDGLQAAMPLSAPASRVADARASPHAEAEHIKLPRPVLRKLATTVVPCAHSVCAQGGCVRAWRIVAKGRHVKEALLKLRLRLKVVELGDVVVPVATAEPVDAMHVESQRRALPADVQPPVDRHAAVALVVHEAVVPQVRGRVAAAVLDALRAAKRPARRLDDGQRLHDERASAPVGRRTAVAGSSASVVAACLRTWPRAAFPQALLGPNKQGGRGLAPAKADRSTCRAESAAAGARGRRRRSSVRTGSRVPKSCRAARTSACPASGASS